MTTLSQPPFSDIVVSNFTAASNTDIEEAYGVFFESVNTNKPVFVEVLGSKQNMPEDIPNCVQFVSKQQLSAAYYNKGKYISLFYVGGQLSGNLYQKKKETSGWGAESALMRDATTNLQAGQGAHIGCTPSTSDGTFDIYYIQNNTNVTVATGPDSSGFWKPRTIRVNDDDLTGLRGGPLAVCKGPKDTVLAYTDLQHKAQVIRRENGTNTWQKLGGIENVSDSSPLAVNLESSGDSAGVFNVFYRRKSDSSNSVSVARVSKDFLPKDILAFSTTDSSSNFAAVTVKRTLKSNCSAGCHCNCCQSIAQRFLAISKRDGNSSLFQYHEYTAEQKKRWVIPQGLVITNSKFEK